MHLAVHVGRVRLHDREVGGAHHVERSGVGVRVRVDCRLSRIGLFGHHRVSRTIGRRLYMVGLVWFA